MNHLSAGKAVALALILPIMLIACGGGGGDDGGGGMPNLAPIANAGAALTVEVGSVQLNGAASSDPDGSIASYSWIQTQGSPVVLNNGNTARPLFFAPQNTASATFAFQLIVTDNRGLASAPSTVTVTVNGNPVPTANAGLPQTVAAGATVSLNGTSSVDPNGFIATYQWTQTGGAPVTIANPSAAAPSFRAPVGATASTLIFQLMVTDNHGAASAASSVTILVEPNLPPVANAGSPASVPAGSTASLNGTASSDAEGPIAGYSWTQTAGPAVTLNNSGSATPSFTAPVALTDSTLTFQLVVTDAIGASSAASTVSITAQRNLAPIARAGTAQTVAVGGAVTLDGTDSFDPGGSIAGYAWTQTSGSPVALTGASTARPEFTAPGAPSTLAFSLVVTDNFGATSASSTVSITVNAGVTMSGTVRFQRVPFLPGSSGGLNYANPFWQPARGLTVNATMIGGAVVVGTAVTDGNGNYTMTVPANLSINIRVVAQMVRSGPQALPRWNVRVQNSFTGNVPYYYFNGAVNSNAGTHNVDIPLGIAANGTRVLGIDVSSGPYAILDTIYTGMQKVLSVAPNADFPELFVAWGVHSEGVFFDTQGGQHIALLGDPATDADEQDQHVIAHEFGHYIAYNFSREDSIGGSHALSDKLDMRVAFGEGFADAFAAIVFDEPVLKDSYAFNGSQTASSRNVETNPSGALGCWCSEVSVSSMVWDLYDSIPEVSDNISLPFQALWDVLTNQHRFTPSVTSIFSFVSGLKTSQPAFAGLINQLVAAQNINANAIDPFATNESFLPFPGMTLPLIPGISRGGGAVVVRSIDDGGRYNKAGNRGFLRFTPTSSGNVTLSLATSNTAANRDPDFVVWSSGTLIAFGLDNSSEYPEVETFAVNAGQTYIIDAYDCANACSTVQGTPGDYNLTVTIN